MLGIKRIDICVLRSILIAIGEKGKIRKTPLMVQTKLDYKRLKSYLKWLELTDCVRVSDQSIALTEHGLKLRSRFLN